MIFSRSSNTLLEPTMKIKIPKITLRLCVTFVIWC